MSQIVNRRKIVAVAFTAALALTGTSQAANLFKTPAAPMPAVQQSLWSDALTWMTTVWTNLVGVSAEKSTTTTTTPTSTTDPAPSSSASSCTNPAGCGDAGWGIDPNG